MVFQFSFLTAIFLYNVLLTESAIYVADSNMNRMVELSVGSQPCKLHSDRGTIENMLRRIDSRYIHRMNSQDLDDLTNSCRDTEQVNKRGGFIFPGTKWCGPGNIANGYNDLGYKTDEDRCCREHDHCPNQLEPGQCRQGICNMSPFTRSHCDCDNAFRRCLHDVNSEVANTIGTLYFNVVQVTCFKDRRSCPQWMRDDLSYTWFCEEWKFTPSDKYIPSIIVRENSTNHINEIPDEGRQKPVDSSKIDQDLELLYGKDSESIEKIMNNPKSSRK